MLWRNVFLVVCFILIAIGAAFFARTYSQNSGENLSEGEIQKVVKRVGEHLLLPEGETPVVARVKDAQTLRASQPFYKDVENGDYLLIYQSESRAILYNPTRDVLVNVGIVQLPPPENSTATSTVSE